MTVPLQFALFALFLAGVFFTGEGTRAVAGVVREKLARGIRNNNPGNLRRTTDAWLGLADEQSDPEFFVFSAPYYGIRALARTLKNYQARHGIATLRALITRWSPASENETDKLVENAARRTGIAPDAPLNIAAHLPALTAAIIVQEVGSQPYDAAVFLQGVNAA